MFTGWFGGVNIPNWCAKCKMVQSSLETGLASYQILIRLDLSHTVFFPREVLSYTWSKVVDQVQTEHIMLNTCAPLHVTCVSESKRMSLQ